MQLYYLLSGKAYRNWGLFEPDFKTLEEAKPIVEAKIVHFDVEMAEWILRLTPLLKAAGYSPHQIGEMAHHAFFLKYSVVAFDPKTALAEVVPRMATSFTTPESKQPVILTGKVIIFAAVLVTGVLWWLFSAHEETVTVKPWQGLWLMTYDNAVWWADCIAHTVPGSVFYQVCQIEGMRMSAHVKNIQDFENVFDRFVFLGTFYEKVQGRIFWHWYDWDFLDVSYIGRLDHVGPNLYKLKKPHRDPWALPPGTVKLIKDQCNPLRAFRDQMTKFW